MPTFTHSSIVSRGGQQYEAVYHVTISTKPDEAWRTKLKSSLEQQRNPRDKVQDTGFFETIENTDKLYFKDNAAGPTCIAAFLDEVYKHAEHAHLPSTRSPGNALNSSTIADKGQISHRVSAISPRSVVFDIKTESAVNAQDVQPWVDATGFNRRLFDGERDLEQDVSYTGSTVTLAFDKMHKDGTYNISAGITAEGKATYTPVFVEDMLGEEGKRIECQRALYPTTKIRLKVDGRSAGRLYRHLMYRDHPWADKAASDQRLRDDHGPSMGFGEGSMLPCTTQNSGITRSRTSHPTLCKAFKGF